MSLLNDRIELKIPSDFDIMDEETIKMKYPTEQRPTLVYTNKRASINVALNLTENPASQELMEPYKEGLVQSFQTNYPDAEWKNSEVIEVNGRQIGYLEFVISAPDAKIYNRMFFTDLDDKLLLCSFNCTLEHVTEWESVSKEIMHSLKLK
ncbi:MAG: hypothetical protein AAFV95_08500 [Bacteroidota bacterium]